MTRSTKAPSPSKPRATTGDAVTSPGPKCSTPKAAWTGRPKSGRCRYRSSAGPTSWSTGWPPGRSAGARDQRDRRAVAFRPLPRNLPGVQRAYGQGQMATGSPGADQSGDPEGSRRAERRLHLAAAFAGMGEPVQSALPHAPEIPRAYLPAGTNDAGRHAQPARHGHAPRVRRDVQPQDPRRHTGAPAPARCGGRPGASRAAVRDPLFARPAGRRTGALDPASRPDPQFTAALQQAVRPPPHQQERAGLPQHADRARQPDRHLDRRYPRWSCDGRKDGSMTIRQLRLLPPLAIGRLGSAAEPMDNYSYTIDDESDRPLGYRRLKSEPTLMVDRSSGEIRSARVARTLEFKHDDRIRPVAPFLEVFALTDDDKLEPLTLELLRRHPLDEKAISWRASVANRKVVRRTANEHDLVAADTKWFHGHDPQQLKGYCKNFISPEASFIDFGHVRFIKPNRKFPEIRLRFTPAKGLI